MRRAPRLPTKRVVSGNSSRSSCLMPATVPVMKNSVARAAPPEIGTRRKRPMASLILLFDSRPIALCRIEPRRLCGWVPTAAALSGTEWS